MLRKIIIGAIVLLLLGLGGYKLFFSYTLYRSGAENKFIAQRYSSFTIINPLKKKGLMEKVEFAISHFEYHTDTVWGISERYVNEKWDFTATTILDAYVDISHIDKEPTLFIYISVPVKFDEIKRNDPPPSVLFVTQTIDGGVPQLIIL